MILATLAVAFVGVSGPDAARVERQLQTLLVREAAVEPMTLDDDNRLLLARHGRGADAIARELGDLGASGVVAAELVDGGGGVTLHVVVYDAGGGIVDLVELPLAGHALVRADLDDLRSLLVPDVAALGTEPEPEPEPEAVATVDDELGADDDDELGAGDDDELGAGDDDELAVDEPHLGLRGAVGIGMMSRSFRSGVAGLPSYASSPVAALRFAAEVRPHPRVSLQVLAERSMAMTTELDAGPADTSLSRWQVGGTYAVRDGRVALSLLGGVGRRELVVSSSATARAPDGRYSYLLAGGELAAELGPKVSVRGLAALEPVFAGAESTMSELGPARRWAVELGGAVEVAPVAHVWLRAEVNYQRFSWTFMDAGARGAGGAVDHYPTATLSVGAAY